MPRRSVASLSIVPAGPAGELPAPPDELSKAEAKVWTETVESKPADWFGPDSYPVLKEYCRAAVMCDALAKASARAVKSGDSGAIKSALDMRDKEARRVASLATKLRLTQQSKYGPRAAATADARANGKRPWQNVS